MIDFGVLAAAKSHHSSTPCCYATALSALPSVCCTRRDGFKYISLGDLPALLIKCVIKRKGNDSNIISASHWTKPSSIGQHRIFSLETSCVCRWCFFPSFATKRASRWPGLRKAVIWASFSLIIFFVWLILNENQWWRSFQMPQKC